MKSDWQARNETPRAGGKEQGNRPLRSQRKPVPTRHGIGNRNAEVPRHGMRATCDPSSRTRSLASHRHVSRPICKLSRVYKRRLKIIPDPPHWTCHPPCHVPYHRGSLRLIQRQRLIQKHCGSLRAKGARNGCGVRKKIDAATVKGLLFWGEVWSDDRD